MNGKVVFQIVAGLLLVVLFVGLASAMLLTINDVVNANVAKIDATRQAATQAAPSQPTQTAYPTYTPAPTQTAWVVTVTPEGPLYSDEELIELEAIIGAALNSATIPGACTGVNVDHYSRLEEPSFAGEDWVLSSKQTYYSYQDNQLVYCGWGIVVVYPSVDKAEIAYWRFLAIYPDRELWWWSENSYHDIAEGAECYDNVYCLGISHELVTEEYLGEHLNLIILNEFLMEGRLTITNPETGEAEPGPANGLIASRIYRDSLWQPLTEALIEWAGQR